MSSASAFIKRLVPNLAPVSVSERLRAWIGALLGISITGLVAGHAFRDTQDLPLLIAPMGASAILLFAGPFQSLCATMVHRRREHRFRADRRNLRLAGGRSGDGRRAGGRAGHRGHYGIACLHPPSGAVALTALLSGPAIHAEGYAFVLWPVSIPFCCSRQRWYSTI